MKNKLEKVLISICILMLSLVVLFYCLWRGSVSGTFAAVKGYMIIFPLIAVLATLGHLVESGSKTPGEYLGSLFVGTKKAKDREIYLDYARIIAASCVILTHACSYQRGEPAEPWKITLLTVVTAVTLVCNPLYIMLSGALLLRSDKKETLWQFYKNRFIKVFLPFFVYYFILLCCNSEINIYEFKTIGSGIRTIFAGATGVAPHYWIMYIFFSLYLVAPFIGKMVRSLNTREIRELTVLLLVSLFVVKYFPYLGISLGITFEFAEWLAVFMLGYIAVERQDAVPDIIFIMAGGLSCILVAAVAGINYDYSGLTFNTAPPMVLFAAGILCGLKRLDGVLKKGKCLIVMALSKYSFSILLIHWFGLFTVTMGFLPIQPLRFGCVGGIVLTLLTALVVCFILGFMMDNTVVIAVRYVVTLPGRIIKNIKKT